jgi:hypothetical protein
MVRLDLLGRQDPPGLEAHKAIRDHPDRRVNEGQRDQRDQKDLQEVVEGRAEVRHQDGNQACS